MTPPFIAMLCAALLLALPCCGGDDEGGSKTATAKTDTAPATATGTETTGADTEPSGQTTSGTVTSTSPEDQPGGAGDEEPARTQALLTGRGGGVTPKLVRVPSYIAIRVELRSADGKTYALRFGGRTLRVGGTVRSASATFAGLRPGNALTGEPVSGGNRVRIEASAEPGP